MRLRLLILALYASALAIPGPALSDTVTFKPSVYPLGEWVDGMVFDGKSIWVAEFGQSDIVQLSAKYAVARRIKLDGAPSRMDLGSDGAIYALDPNNNKVWRLAPAGGQIKTIPGLKGHDGCATSLATGGGAFVWVLYTCNGEDAILLRTDPKTGAQTTVTLGSGGGELLVRDGKVWVNTDKFSVVDENTLKVSTFDVQIPSTPDIAVGPGPFAANADTVYVATMGADGASNFVAAIDPATLKETARTTVDQSIEAMTADARNVVALGANGRIFVLSAGGLALQRVINLTVANVEPRKAMIRNGDLFITDFRIPNQNERGALLVLHNWRPAAATTPAPAPK